jgi:transposase
VFLDESGFLLVPTVRRTWAPRGETPVVRHSYERTKVSAISAVTVSPRRQRVGLYVHLYEHNISQTEVTLFLKDLLRHLRGNVIVLWDNASIHKGADLVEYLRSRPRVTVECFPGYAPELNPDELVWSYFKAELANGRPETIDDLMESLTALTKKVAESQRHLRGFVLGSELPAFLSP